MNGSSMWAGQQHNSQPLPVNTLQQIESDTILVGFNNQVFTNLAYLIITPEQLIQIQHFYVLHLN